MNAAVNAPAFNRFAAPLVLIGAAALIGAQFALLGARDQLFADFHAFYCGGAAVLAHRDPYVTASLLRCENLAHGFGLHHTPRSVVAPVPFPAYAFAVFAPFAALPYVASAALWLMLTLACTYGAAAVSARLCKLPLSFTLALFSAAYPLAVLGLGEVAPLAIFALVVAADALQRERYWAAAVALSATAILPHAMLPAFIAAALFVARMRMPLLACLSGLALLQLLLGGTAPTLEYFANVLPAHARSEIGYIAQYGTTWIAHALGASESASLLAGEAFYAAACVAGIVAARVAARDLGAPAFLLVPVVFAVAFAPFMHYSEMTLALPGAMALLAVRPSDRRVIAAAILLAVPWQWIVAEAPLALPAAVLAVAVIASLRARSPAPALAAAAAAVLYALVLLTIAERSGPQLQKLAYAGAPTVLAQASWTQFIRSQGASTGIVWWIAKGPTWTGLALLAACCYRRRTVNEHHVRAALVQPAPIRT